MGMKKILVSLAATGIVLAGAAAYAAEEAHNPAAPTHFPIKEPQEESWSFAGPFGTYDKAQLQRGLQVYKEVCSACHSMNLVAFRTLEGLGYSDAQVKAFAAEYTIHDGPNDDGDMFDRPGKPSLVLDLIEEFRQPVVDRAVFALLNQRVALAQDGRGRLDEPTRAALARRVNERLESDEPYAPARKRLRLRTILQTQARRLAVSVRGEGRAYEAWVARW